MKPGRYAHKMMYAAGASGTVTLEPGDRIVEITVQASLATGTVAIFGGTAIPVVGAAAPDTKLLHLGPHPDASRFEATAAAKTVVFVNTVSYMVAFMRLRPVAPV